MLFKHHVQTLACHGALHKHRDIGVGANFSTESIHASSIRVLRLAKTCFAASLTSCSYLQGHTYTACSSGQMPTSGAHLPPLP